MFCAPSNSFSQLWLTFSSTLSFPLPPPPLLFSLSSHLLGPLCWLSLRDCSKVSAPLLLPLTPHSFSLLIPPWIPLQPKHRESPVLSFCTSLVFLHLLSTSSSPSSPFSFSHPILVAPLLLILLPLFSSSSALLSSAPSPSLLPPVSSLLLACTSVVLGTAVKGKQRDWKFVSVSWVREGQGGRESSRGGEGARGGGGSVSTIY